MQEEYEPLPFVTDGSFTTVVSQSPHDAELWQEFAIVFNSLHGPAPVGGIWIASLNVDAYLCCPENVTTDCQPCRREHSCSRCPAGSFKNTTGNGACVACSENSISQRGAESCTQCGENTVTIGTSRLECVCDAGLQRENRSCVECLQGSFKAAPGDFACDLCAVDTFANSTGSRECTPCPPNEETNGALGASLCVCSAGYFRNDAVCEPCAAGTFKSSSGDDVCLPCAVNAISASSALECSPCAPNSVTVGDDRTSCVCDAGYERVGDTCQACPRGTYKAVVGDSSTCVMCPHAEAVGYLYDTISTEEASVHCTECNPNSGVIAHDHTQCYCDAGYFDYDAPITALSNCTACPAGSFKATRGSDACVSCPEGSTSPAAASSCDECRQNEVEVENQCVCDAGFQRVISDCEPCPSGMFKADAGEYSCTACEEDTYSGPAPSTACQPCPSNSDTNGLDTQFRCFCEEGYEPGAVLGENDVLLSCTACDVGSFKSTGGNEVCVSCGNGSTTPSTASTVCECDVGFEGNASLGTCTFCPAGTSKGAIADGQCVPCEPGTFAELAGQPDCAICPRDKFSNASATECSPCGNFSNASEGSSRCLCKDGWVSEFTYLDHEPHTEEEHDRQFFAYGESCVPCPEFFCPAGQYQDGVLACADCPPFSNSSDFTLTRRGCDCWPGYGEGENQTCVACGFRLYKDWYGMEPCRTCPQN